MPTRSTAGNLQDAATRLMVGAARGTAWSDAQVSARWRKRSTRPRSAKDLDPAFKVYALGLP